eukprot:490158_1
MRVLNSEFPKNKLFFDKPDISAIASTQKTRNTVKIVPQISTLDFGGEAESAFRSAKKTAQIREIPAWLLKPRTVERASIMGTHPSIRVYHNLKHPTEFDPEYELRPQYLQGTEIDSESNRLEHAGARSLRDVDTVSDLWRARRTPVFSTEHPSRPALLYGPIQSDPDSRTLASDGPEYTAGLLTRPPVDIKDVHESFHGKPKNKEIDKEDSNEEISGTAYEQACARLERTRRDQRTQWLRALPADMERVSAALHANEHPEREVRALIH